MKSLDFAAEIERISEPELLWQRVQECFASLGYDFIIYLSSDDDLTHVQLLTTIPEIYTDTDPREDPFLHYCCKSYETTLTGPEFLTDHDYLPPQARTFIERASATGFIAGVGIPTRIEGAARFGGFNLGTRLSATTFRETMLPRIEDTRLLCMIVHRRLEEVLPLASDYLGRLSPRERDVIALIVEGNSRKDCARLLSLSPNTVADYTKSAYRKLGVNNRVQAARLLAR